MMIATAWHNNISLRFCPLTIVQIVFSAGTVFVLSAIQAISGPRLGRVTLLASLRQIKQCMEYLDEIGISWVCALSVKNILINLLDMQLKPRLQLRSGETGLKSEVVHPTPYGPSLPQNPPLHSMPHNHSPTGSDASHSPSAGQSNLYAASLHAGEWPMNMMDAVRDAMSTMTSGPSAALNSNPPVQQSAERRQSLFNGSSTPHPPQNYSPPSMNQMNQNNGGGGSSGYNPNNDTLMNLNVNSTHPNTNLRVDSRGLGLGMDLGGPPFFNSNSFPNQGMPMSFMPVDSPFPPMDLDSLPFVGGTMPMLSSTQEPAPSSVSVDFTDEELAIMEQLYRQQQMQQANVNANNMMFGR